ncbi:MAG: CRISPR-associated endoribonuclease Cas6 [Pseudonocardiaceae bacterium]
MRFRVDVAAGAPGIPWPEVHSPARGVGYALIRSQDEQLATQLHDHGWAGSPLVPLGVSPPLFQGAPRRHGVYTTSDRGSVWLGSPVPQIAAALLAGIAGRSEIRWGSVALMVKGVQLEDIPDHQAGETVFESRTPVLLRHENEYIMPEHEAYQNRLRHNLAHRADVLGLPNAVDLDVLEAGPRRRFEVQRKPRFGATIRVRITAAPTLLDALYVGGIGLATNQGFGWLR